MGRRLERCCDSRVSRLGGQVFERTSGKPGRAVGAVAARRAGRVGGSEERRNVEAAGGDGVRGAGAAGSVLGGEEGDAPAVQDRAGGF